MGDSVVCQTEKTLVEHKEKVPQEDQDLIKADIAAVKEAAAGEDTTAEALKEKIEALKKSSMKIGEAMYKNTPPDDAPPGGEESQSTAQDRTRRARRSEEA